MSMDIDIAHRRRWPDRPMNGASRLWLLVTSPGLQLLLIHRIAHWIHVKRNNDSEHRWLWHVILIPLGLLKLATKINTKSEICNDCEIEGGVFFSDQGHITFGAKKTGGGTIIGTRITVGMSHTKRGRGRPEIGRNVWVGSDCVIYGAITIGDGATLLPGTVLTKSVPANVVMQGNPARLVWQNFDNAKLRSHPDTDAVQYVTAIRDT
ncbi:MAG: hypothetical protein Q7U18_13805 [Methylobacter sp.]|nr:hypothetical protein [Methylobacter sp.]